MTPGLKRRPTPLNEAFNLLYPEGEEATELSVATCHPMFRFGNGGDKANALVS